MARAGDLNNLKGRGTLITISQHQKNEKTKHDSRVSSLRSTIEVIDKEAMALQNSCGEIHLKNDTVLMEMSKRHEEHVS